LLRIAGQRDFEIALARIIHDRGFRDTAPSLPDA
jgi:hypothetical protein